MPYRDNLEAALSENQSLKAELNRLKKPKGKKMKLLLRFVRDRALITFSVLTVIFLIGILVRACNQSDVAREQLNKAYNQNTKIRDKKCKEVCVKEHPDHDLIASESDIKRLQRSTYIECTCKYRDNDDKINIADPVKE